MYILLEQRGSFCIFHIEPLLPTQSQIQSSRLSLVDSVRAKSFSSLPGDAPGQLSPSIPRQSVLGTRDSSSLALRGLGDTGPSVADLIPRTGPASVDGVCLPVHTSEQRIHVLSAQPTLRLLRTAQGSRFLFLPGGEFLFNAARPGLQWQKSEATAESRGRQGPKDLRPMPRLWAASDADPTAGRSPSPAPGCEAQLSRSLVTL